MKTQMVISSTHSEQHSIEFLNKLILNRTNFILC